MAKGKDSKKAVRKKPEKTMKEKRNEQKAKIAANKQVQILNKRVLSR